MNTLKKVAMALLLTAALITAPLLADGYFKLQDNAASVSAPQVLTVTSSAITTVFTLNSSLTVGRPILRTIQNTGTVPVLYAINTTNVTTANYHGVLAPGTANRDGLGSVLDLSKVPFPVSLITESSSTTIAVVELTQ